MPKYILKRIVGTIPTLIIVVTFVFFFVRLIPGVRRDSLQESRQHRMT